MSEISEGSGTHSNSGLIQTLETDYRQLAFDSRKSEGFAGIFGGSSSHPEVKEAAERVLVLLRNVKQVQHPNSELQGSKDVLLKPLELACSTTSAKLINQAVVIVQKLVTCNAVGSDSMQLLISLLTNVEKVHDESVQLKILQTCLILLQSPIHPQSAEAIGSVLSLCFRALIPKGRANQVASTASATVRQAVAIVFSYVDVPRAAELAAGSPVSSEYQSRSQSMINDQMLEEEYKCQNEVLIACQRLLEDLIAITTGSPAKWIKTPSLPKTVSLEVLDFTLLSSANIFNALPEFESSLSLRIIQLLQSQLQDLLDAAGPGTSQNAQSFAAFKATIKCVRTVLLQYHPSIGNRCRSLIQLLLKGVQSSQSMIHRIAISQLIRQLLGDASLVIFLFSTFDANKENQTDVLVAMVNVMASATEGGLEGDFKNKVDALSQMFFSREMGIEAEMELSLPSQLHATALTVVSLDAILRCMHSEACIVSHSLGIEQETDEKPPISPRFHYPSLPLGNVSVHECEALVNATWEPMLAVVTDLLRVCSYDKLEKALLKELQEFTESIGKLHLSQPMNAYLESLCQIALSDAVSTLTMSEEQSESSKTRGFGNDADEKYRLTPKTIQIMKTVFKIARELANDLGPAWHMVLEAMYSLDHILVQKPVLDKKLGSTDLGTTGSADVSAEDVRDLTDTLQSMFEGTREMSSEGVVSLLSGLRDVSLHHLPQAEQVSQPKMSALNRMVDVLLANDNRIYDLWGTFLSHVLELVADNKPQIREAAIDALGKAITGALASLSASSGEEDSTGGLEHMLLVALEALHNDDKGRDVQLGVLRVLLSILQRNGERLTDGWTPVFRLLGIVPEQGTAETISVSFESLQLIHNDYMAAMANDRIKKCLEVAELFGKQQVDVNVSLTTISLLWNAGDMLCRRATRLEAVSDAPESLEQLTETDSLVTRKSSEVFTAEIELLLDIVYSALFSISKDPRPEVRNSGARTLFAIVSAHGERLSKQLWQKCLWEMLFPLLRYAFHMSVTSSKEEAEAALLGQSKGEQVRLVMHHSRNTEQKQWDETVVVSLAGMTRLMRTHLNILSEMEGIEDGWSELMVVVESSLAGGRKEVALAAMNLLGGVLGQGEVNIIISKSMWRRGMRALDVGVVAATSSGCQVPLGARTELVNLVGTLYNANRRNFDHDSSLDVYRWVENFCKNPWSEDDAANPVQPVGMPPVQKTALGLLPRLCPQHDEMLWPDFLRMVAKLVEPTHAIALFEIERKDKQNAEEEPIPSSKPASSTADQLPPPASAQYRLALNAAFVEKAMDHLISLYETAPLWARAESLADIASVLGRCLELRYTAYSETLWRKAATVFLKLVPLGVLAVDATSRKWSAEKTEEDMDLPWISVADALSGFLLGPAFFQEQELKRRNENLSRSTSSVAEDENKALPVVPVVEVARRRKSLNRDKGRGKRESKDQTAWARDPGTNVEEHGVSHGGGMQGREDAELELRVLDALTDEILTACGSASVNALDRLIGVVERGMVRPQKFNIPQTTTYSNFSHVCIRKMYALCSRGSDASSRKNSGIDASDSSVNEEARQVRYHVARRALPCFLRQCNKMIRQFAEETQFSPIGGPETERAKLEQIICVLEVLATMTLAPSVADAVLPPQEPITDFIHLMRKKPDMANRGKERTHLLLVYGSLCSLVTCKEGRIRDMVRDVLGLIGAELGISFFENA